MQLSTAGSGPAEISADRESCSKLLCAVIALAIRDLEKIWRLERKPTLTEYEGKKLARLSNEWRPDAFLEGEWFEEICLMLQVEPGTIRAAVRARRNGINDSLSRQGHALAVASPVAAVVPAAPASGSS